jgi:hypothetical protein
LWQLGLHTQGDESIYEKYDSTLSLARGIPINTDRKQFLGITAQACVLKVNQGQNSNTRKEDKALTVAVRTQVAATPALLKNKFMRSPEKKTNCTCCGSANARHTDTSWFLNT